MKTENTPAAPVRIDADTAPVVCTACSIAFEGTRRGTRFVRRIGCPKCGRTTTSPLRKAHRRIALWLMIGLAVCASAAAALDLRFLILLVLSAGLALGLMADSRRRARVEEVLGRVRPMRSVRRWRVPAIAAVVVAAVVIGVALQNAHSTGPWPPMAQPSGAQRLAASGPLLTAQFGNPVARVAVQRARTGLIEVEVRGFASNATGGEATLRIVNLGPAIDSVGVGGSFEGSRQTGTLRASLPIHGMTIPTGRTVTTEVHWTFPSPLEARYRLRLEPVFDANGARKAVSFSFDVPA